MADPIDTDTRWMLEALAEAEAAAQAGDVPVGAVIVDAKGELVGRGRNEREAAQDPTAHAEVCALRQAAAALGHWRLEGATVYVTLEPCPMCAGALVNARIARLVYGCADPKAGAVDTLFSIGQDGRLNHRFAVERGVLEEACAGALKRFFADLRAAAKARAAARAELARGEQTSAELVRTESLEQIEASQVSEPQAAEGGMTMPTELGRDAATD